MRHLREFLALRGDFVDARIRGAGMGVSRIAGIVVNSRLFVLCFHAPSLCLAAGVWVCVNGLAVSARQPAADPPAASEQTSERMTSAARPAWLQPKRDHLDEARRLTAAALATMGEARHGLALEAAEAARRSLAFGPANAYAWLALAWADFAAGDEAAARTALERSWDWAPHSGNLSFLRLLLALHWWPEAGPAERSRIVDEARMARVVHRAAFIDEMGRNPRLWTVWRLIYEIDYPKEFSK